MKALLLLVVILAGVWLWRSRAAPLARPTKPSSPSADSKPPQEMVMCAHCGMHIPGNEVVTGKQGVYCSQDHLHQSET